MPDTVRKVEYFSVFVPNKPAQAFNVLSTLVSADINLLGCSGVQRGRIVVIGAGHPLAHGQRCCLQGG